MANLERLENVFGNVLFCSVCTEAGAVREHGRV